MATNRRVSRELLRRWDERVAAITRNTFELNETAESREQRVARARRDYPYFVATYFPHLATSPTAAFQTAAAKYIADNPRARALFEWARGHAKSTHLGCLIPLWLLARGDSRNAFGFMVLVSKSEEAAKGLLGDLQAELSANESYIHDFEIKAEKGTEWQVGRFSISNGTTFVALGRGQSPRGLKKRGQRPDYIVIDDIDDDGLVRNEKRVSDTYEWVMTALFGTMAVGRGRFIMVGNRIGTRSVLAKYAETPNVHRTVVNILDNKGQPAWRENYTPAEIRELRDTLGERKFYKEYMNAPIDEGTVFKREWMRFGKPLRLRDYIKLIAYTDPSFKATKANDYKATILVGKTREGYYHVLKAYAAQTSITEMVAWHYEIDDYCIRGNKPVRYYMEANFIQDLLLDEFKKEGAIRGGRQIPVTPDRRKKIDKYSRIETMQPLFERGFIIFNEAEKESLGMQVLIEQLLAIEAGSRLHDDAPDALESAIYMLNKIGRTESAPCVIAKRPDRRY